jgi:hypothetical protein
MDCTHLDGRAAVHGYGLGDRGFLHLEPPCPKIWTEASIAKNFA